jgi:two-component system chemotaxis response regulator CheB
MSAPERPIGAVAIGASAGGVEALLVLLPALPAGLRIPVFVVLHLPREQPSLLVEIFAPRCALRVVEAEDKMPIEAGVVYVAPPDYHMLVEEERRIALSADAAVNYSRPSIDVLFEAVADAYGERALGIILTGGSADGSAGLEAIHRGGGTTVVQRPENAQVPFMVESALRRVPVDFVLTLDGIAALLARLRVEDPSTPGVPRS